METLYAPEETIMVSKSAVADIAVFVTVVDRGSFSAAAERLEMSKSQVSKVVSRLERALGARLLNRTTRRLNLTEAGATLYEASGRALQAIDDAQLAVSRLQGEARGLLRVSASIAFGSTQLPGILRRVADQHPELAVDLVLEDRHVDLVSEGIDVAVRITHQPPDSSLVFRRLGPNRQVVCAAPSYIARRGLPRTLADLASHECVAHMQRVTPRIWHLIGADGARVSVPIKGRFAINSALGVRRAALDGLGIVELNSYLVGEDIQAGRLVRLLPQYRAQELSFHAVYPDRRHLPPKVRVFVDALMAEMSPEPHWDAFLGPRLTRPKPGRTVDGAARGRTASARTERARRSVRG
jgi:DNA-binding transcriptional LysR family regulator